MFGFLSEMLAGGHEELPRRRRVDPNITFDPAAGSFVSVDGDDHESAWLGRGVVPGQPAPELAQTPADALSLVEEMQQLATEAAARSAAPKA